MTDTIPTISPAGEPRPATPVSPPKSGSSRALGLLALTGVAGLSFVVWQQSQQLQSLQSALQPLISDSGDLQGVQAAQHTLGGQLTAIDGRLQQQEQLAQQLQAAQQQFINNQQQSQLSLQQQLQMTTLSLSEQGAQLSMLSDELESVSALLADSGQQALRTQVLAEVAGMLRIADLRLQVAQDVEMAGTLLRNADGLLARLLEPAVATLRSQLANDLSALQSVQTVDVMQLYQQLDAAIAKQQALPAQSPTAANALSVTAPAATAPVEPGWFDETVDFLSQYFVVTRRDTAVTPLLTPEQSWLIHKGIELQLNQAQLAALRGEQALFRQALDEAGQAINDNLSGDGKTSLLAELNTLRAANLRPALPSLAGRIAAVQQLQQQAASGPVGAGQ